MTLVLAQVERNTMKYRKGCFFLLLLLQFMSEAVSLGKFGGKKCPMPGGSDNFEAARFWMVFGI